MTINIYDYIDIGTNSFHNASSYQVALDKDFTKIIDESHKDKINVKSWKTPLKKIDGTGYYSNLDELYARVKVWINDNESPWFEVKPVNQNECMLEITEDGKESIFIDAIKNKINMC